MIDIQSETLIPFSKLAKWTEENLGNRISPNSAHRWRLRGCRGIKLETILLGGTRTTSVEALQRFIEATTRAQDGHSVSTSIPGTQSQITAKEEAYLESEGFK